MRLKPLRKCIFIGIIVFLTFSAKAQETLVESVADSVVTEQVEPHKAPPPRIATAYSAVLPGLGQIKNHQWWKVPFIYGGFVAIGYMADYYKTNKNLYIQAYWDIGDKNPNTNAYYDVNYVSGEVDEFNSGVVEEYRSKFMNSEKFHDRYLNISLIAAAGFYLLNVLDANVNAHFIDFDISEDLSLNLSPIVIDPMACRPVPGMTLVFNF